MRNLMNDRQLVDSSDAANGRLLRVLLVLYEATLKIFALTI